MKLDETDFKLLKQLRKEFGSVCIFGGAVRDFVLGGNLKDVDVLLQYNSTSLYKTRGLPYVVDYALAKVLPVDDYTVSDSNNQYMSLTDVRVDFTYNQKPYQLLLTSTPLRYLFESLDFNCNKVYYNGISIRKTKAFREFEATKVLEINPQISANTDKRVIAFYTQRVQSLVDRYPDIKLGQSFSKWKRYMPTKGISYAF